MKTTGLFIAGIMSLLSASTPSRLHAAAIDYNQRLFRPRGVKLNDFVPLREDQRMHCASRIQCIFRTLIIGLTMFLLLAVSCCPAHSSVVVVLIGCGNDDICQLSELLAGGAIIIDDTAFSGFGNFLSRPMGFRVRPAAVNVFPIIANTDPGLLFVGPGEFFVPLDVDITQRTNFSYVVTSLSKLRLVDAHLALSGQVEFMFEAGSIFIDETIEGTALMRKLSVDLTAFNSVPQDAETFPPQTVLNISNEILLFGPAGLLQFQQTFSRIPGPASIILFAIGALGMGWFASRRRGIHGRPKIHQI